VSAWIFGLGNQKTGNTSIAAALTNMGLRVRQFHEGAYVAGRKFLSTGEGAEDVLHQGTRWIDAWLDYPLLFYKELGQRFPDAKWIYNIRDNETWIPSFGQHLWRLWNKRPERKQIVLVQYHERVFGVPWPTPEQAIKRRAENRRKLTKFLATRDSLTLNVFEDGKWTYRLAEFVGRAWTPEAKPPRKNVSAYLNPRPEELKGTPMEAWTEILCR